MYEHVPAEGPDRFVDMSIQVAVHITCPYPSNRINTQVRSHVPQTCVNNNVHATHRLRGLRWGHVLRDLGGSK